MTNTVLGVPLSIDIKEPSKKQKILNLIVEIKKESNDNLLNYMLDGILKALNNNFVGNKDTGDYNIRTINYEAELVTGVTSVNVSGVIFEHTRNHKLDKHKELIRDLLKQYYSISKTCNKLEKEHNIKINYQVLRNYILKNKLLY